MKLNFLDHSPDLRFNSLFPELQSSPKKKSLKLHEPITATILGILGANIGWIVGGTTIWLSQIIAYAAIAVIVSYSLYSTYASNKKGKHGRTGLQTIDESGQLINTRETSTPVKLVYGKTKVGGNWVFADQSVSNPNLLNIVVSWGEGECDSISDSIDWMPQFTGTGYDDLHTGGEVSTFTTCTCDQTCYEYSACTCNMTCHAESCDCDGSLYEWFWGEGGSCSSGHSCLTCYSSCYLDGGW